MLTPADGDRAALARRGDRRRGGPCGDLADPAGAAVYVPFNKMLPMVHPNELVVGGWDSSMGCLGEFVKYSIVDLTAPTFEYLDEIVEDLAGRVERGENVYVHCWAGRGRAAVVSGCVLAKLYGLPAHDALEYVGKAYATRGDERRQSPETLDQRRLMSRWIIAKVPPNA